LQHCLLFQANVGVPQSQRVFSISSALGCEQTWGRNLEEEAQTRRREEEEGREMIKTADLAAYGPIVEAVERLLDSLPVDAVLLRRDKEIVASNESAAEKGLVPGIKCHEGWLHTDKPCPWGRAKKALNSESSKSGMISSTTTWLETKSPGACT